MAICIQIMSTNSPLATNIMKIIFVFACFRIVLVEGHTDTYGFKHLPHNAPLLFHYVCQVLDEHLQASSRVSIVAHLLCVTLYFLWSLTVILMWRPVSNVRCMLYKLSHKQVTFWSKILLRWLLALVAFAWYPTLMTWDFVSPIYNILLMSKVLYAYLYDKYYTSNENVWLEFKWYKTNTSSQFMFTAIMISE